MPWWEQYTYLDGLRQEGIIGGEGEESESRASGLPIRSVAGKADWA